ncbi:MAG: serine hydrolase domain-containing protein, partial [Actinomycetota bacterium]
VVSLLVGRAVAEGLVMPETEIDDVLGPKWTDHGETAGITVRHLLTMTSGLDDELAVVADPGERWVYSGAFAQLFGVLEEVAGDDLDTIAADWLFEPTGADGATFYQRRFSGYAPIGLRASAADLAAIGVAVADRSVPGLAPSWYDTSFSPSQGLNEAYGLLWWLNGQDSFVLPGQIREPTPGALVPTAPDDLVAALGKDDQKLYVSTELGLVAARLGDRAAPRTRAALSSFDAQLWDAILAART